MNETMKLLPCAHCGGEPRLVMSYGKWRLEEKRQYHILCMSCGIETTCSTKKIETIKKWNTRHSPKEVQGLVEALIKISTMRCDCVEIGDPSCPACFAEAALQAYRKGGK